MSAHDAQHDRMKARSREGLIIGDAVENVEQQTQDDSRQRSDRSLNRVVEDLLAGRPTKLDARQPPGD